MVSDERAQDRGVAADDVDAPDDGPAARLDADEGEPESGAFAKDETRPDRTEHDHGYGYE